jgi:membrane-bound lytic murein transglycosylase A
MMSRHSIQSLFYGGLFFVGGCVSAPPKPAPLVPPAPIPVSRYSALEKVEEANLPAFEDDADTASLHTAILESFVYYQSLPDNQLFVLGHDTYTVQDMIASMASLSILLENSPNPKEWVPVLQSSFTVYQSVGADPDKTVVFSSYYEPAISVRLTPNKTYRYPLYGRPPDLVDVDLSLFDSAYQGIHVSGRREGRALFPYPTRTEIDGKKILQHSGLEIAWAKNPMDVLDLQIEGSGWLDFGEGKLRRVRYDGDNGRRYRSVGQYLISTGRIPAKKFSRKVFLQYMARHPKERQALLNVNDRYVFFRVDTSTAALYAYGNISVPLTPGRSIATDPKVFPRGALAWIDTERAIVTKKDRVSGKRPLKRFMLNQDEGGAIQGPGRVDIFAGHGGDAKRLATHLWNKGKLYFLVKKSN